MPIFAKNAVAIVALLEKRGVKTRLLEEAGAPPVVFGEIETPGATRTLVFYAHYDGQPLDPKEWATPPWQPVVRDAPLESRWPSRCAAGKRSDQSRMADLRAVGVG